ncbi:hypothetical protein Bca52824_019137 [Brassica carinata]|uniref:Uncharacterized protein n=1 Tax=Brassica carinata TaxID=52824 RepID=A0A8X8AY79_BRACI|nr:hypothetical protein Bca52824_019137 [Brassica carinata]
MNKDWDDSITSATEVATLRPANSCKKDQKIDQAGSCGKKVDDVSGRLSLLPQSSHSVSYASTFIGEEEKATSSSPIGDQILMAGVKVSHVRIVVM